MKTTSKSIKINANFEIPLDTELEIGKDCLIGLEGQIASKSDESNEDDSMSQVWRVKAIKGNFVAKNGVKQTLKDKTRKSVAFRTMITQGWGLEYEPVMNVLLANSDELRAFYEKYKL